MGKKYFPNQDFNKIPCGIVAFENNAPWKIAYANEEYYSYFSNGNFDTLNIFDEDTVMLEDIKDNLLTSKSTNIYYRCDIGNSAPCRVVMAACSYTDNIYLGVLGDATERYNIHKRLEREKEKFAMALCSDKNMVFEDNRITDVSTLYMQAEENGTDITAIRIENIYGAFEGGMVHDEDKKFFLENIYNEQEKTLSARMKINNDNDWKWYRMYRQFEHDENGNITRIFGVLRDVDDEKRNEEDLRKSIEMDPVLKIYNRNAGVNKINSYLRNNATRKDYALLIMDIDDFKNINDTYGHLYGDAVIEMTAGAIKESVGSLGFAGRYGGDEFFAFIHSASNEEIGAIADEILERMKNFHLADDTHITGSIGIARGDMFTKAPNYSELLEKADKALYHVKENGKAHWIAYDDNMTNAGGHSLDYEAKEDDSSNEFLESKDMMKVFLELSSGARTSDEAVYNIMRYIMDRFHFEWLRIMQVNCSDDLVTVKYEWCRDEDFHNGAGKSGYYVHSDIMKFRDYFEENPIFMVCPENCVGFSPKFQREFEKNMRHNVVYISNPTTDDNFFMFVCARFDKRYLWEEEECSELNAATKLMAMYISQSGRKSENEKKLQYMIDYDRRTGLYSIAEFYVQLGRLRKIAKEQNEEIILLHCDIGNFMKFNRDFGIEAGDDVLLSYGRHIKDHLDPERCIASHLDGTDIFYLGFKVKKGDRSLIQKYNSENIYFCEVQNDKYNGAKLVLRTGVYFIKQDEDGGYGFDCAALAKKYIKNRNRTFFVPYGNEMEML